VSPANLVDVSKQYRQGVLAALSRGGWGSDLEHAAHAAAQRLARARQLTFAPGTGHAVLAAARTLLFIAVPLVAAERLSSAGWGWAAVPLVLLAGIGLYGGVAILHDLAHGSFLRSRRLNGIFGHLLAPLLLMEFSGFRRSHLDHHRHSQSTIDPKRFGVEHKEGTTDPEHCSLDLFPAPLRGPLRLGASVVTLPLRARQLIYLLVLPLIMGPAVLFFSGEFSIARRDWRRRESWTATLASVVFLTLLYAWSPRLLALFVIALLFGHAFTFHVFAAHLSPHQVYWTSARRVALPDALNVSDIHCGGLARWLGHGLSDYHSLHHLSPTIPCYHLPAAEAMIGPDLAGLRAPAINLLEPASCAVLFDAVFRGVAYKNSESWDYAGGGGLRRIATPDSDG
jgi:omega-6 fatty acid desaturase (delta-12 desaturase)